MVSTVHYETDNANECILQLQQQMKLLEDSLDIFSCYSSLQQSSPCVESTAIPICQAEKVAYLEHINKKLKNDLILKNQLVQNIKSEMSKVKIELEEKSKHVDSLLLELEIVKKERNEFILQAQTAMNKEAHKASHIFKDSISSINSYSTNLITEEGKSVMEKINNEKYLLEGMLFETKIKYAEIQGEIGKYRDQNASLRKKLEEANKQLMKKDEIIQKFMLSKEKIPFIDNSMIPNASRLDLTIALTENQNLNNFGIIKSVPNVAPSKFNLTPKTKETNTNYLTTSPCDPMGNLQLLKQNYNTHNGKVSLVSTPDKNLVIQSAKDHRGSGSLMSKFKQMFSSEKKH